MNRRNFLKTSSAAGLVPGTAGVWASQANEKVVPEWESPIFNLHKSFSSPVKIASIELLRAGGSRYFLRTRSADGGRGSHRD